jgi:hypothetical protein
MNQCYEKMESENDAYLQTLVPLPEHVVGKTSDDVRRRLFSYRAFVRAHQPEIIGDAVKAIPDYQTMFRPVVDSCPVSVAGAGAGGSGRFVNYKVERVPHAMSLAAFYDSPEVSSRKKLNSIYYTYIQILKHVRALVGHSIVHNNLSPAKCVMDAERAQPFTVGFGRAIHAGDALFADPVAYIRKLCSAALPGVSAAAVRKTVVPLRLYCTVLRAYFDLDVAGGETCPVWDLERHVLAWFAARYAYGDLSELERDAARLGSGGDGGEGEGGNRVEMPKGRAFVSPLDRMEFHRELAPVLGGVIRGSRALWELCGSVESAQKYAIEGCESIRRIMAHAYSSDASGKRAGGFDFVRMIHAIVESSWTTWDLFSATLYQRALFRENVPREGNPVFERCMDILTAALQPSIIKRADVERTLAQYESLF